jgi:hypothetical protein
LGLTGRSGGVVLAADYWHCVQTMSTSPTNAKSSELTEKKVLMLFPTPMFMGKLPHITLCERNENEIREMRT